ncbi:DNA (cytosine-5)-methyltransferase 1 [Humidesulfovibrio mexicanus]|uniref:Cytosine-specific methyltransferase n=1 Tax=Humidesulfovibrio mexicanus TaxID=147047 RepID=A0A239B683_9BACT|nr:DNA cytosine methyltransferase [Humidesulfovibrio mexicanus]SNS03289.1 DNA (cytosine-5)-methyltransferase 1 [Humidesulfovibrio mexicanus]
MSKGLTILSLFTGAGGLDYGFEAAGFETCVALELDKLCCTSLEASRKWPVIPEDIHQTPTRAILDKGGLRAGELDLLIGGPPCQPFSKSGWWANGDSLRLDDPRADTLAGYLRVLREARPRAFLLENVAGLAFEGKNEGLRLLTTTLETINQEAGTNYRPKVLTLNAANFGVPQARSRVFVIGSREGLDFTPPRETHADPSMPSLGGLEPWHTAWDAIGGLGEPRDLGLQLTGKWADLLPSIPEGQNYLWHTSRMGGMPLFGWRTRYWNFLLKLAKDRPAWTIQAQPGPATGPFHWDNRKLSGEELARLQTFPKDAVILGGRADVQRQLGNAVPSLLAEVLGREIARQFFKVKQKTSKPKLLPKRRDDLPPPEPVASVPAKYHALAGDHASHPGTGQGPLYLRA